MVQYFHLMISSKIPYLEYSHDLTSGGTPTLLPLFRSVSTQVRRLYTFCNLRVLLNKMTLLPLFRSVSTQIIRFYRLWACSSENATTPQPHILSLTIALPLPLPSAHKFPACALHKPCVLKCRPRRSPSNCSKALRITPRGQLT